MSTRKLLAFVILLAATVSGACMIKDTPAPPFAGPSELALSLAITADPDVLSQNGASQARIEIMARNENGQPAPNVRLRADIVANGTVVDFGSLSTKSITTDSNGLAVLTYTAPAWLGVSFPDSVSIFVTPVGTDAANSNSRVVNIRLVPPGFIIPGGPSPSFTFSPASPTAFEDVIFTSTSQAAIGTAIVSYAWNFGDGSTASGPTAIHRFSEGNYTVTLTVTDSSGFSSSTFRSISIGAGSSPTAVFTTSPSEPVANQQIFFNASSSTPGFGRRIVRYDWDFGTGSTASGVTVSKSYDAPGTYTVTLTVTDDVGQTGRSTTALTVIGGLTAAFSLSPTNPRVGTVVNFNGSASRPSPGATITNYAWDFGDGITSTGPSPTTSHAYSGAFTYTIRLTVTESTGSTATVTESVTTSP